MTVNQVLPPPDFAAALLSLRDSQVDKGLIVKEVPAPSRLAPWSAAVEVKTVEGGDHPVGRATLVILYDPDQESLWDSPFRLVGQARMDVDEHQATDPVLSEALWSTLNDNFVMFGVEPLGLVGTVTRELSQTFGGLVLHGSDLSVELRCSWSPLGMNLAGHLSAWCETLRTNSGLFPHGVAAIPSRSGTREGGNE